MQKKKASDRYTIIIDDVPVEWHRWKVDVKNDVEEDYFIRDAPVRYARNRMIIVNFVVGNQEITLESSDYHLTYGDDNTIIISGPLRTLFPQIYAHRLLEPWHIAYLKVYNYPDHYVHTKFNDDEIFDGKIPEAFRYGYEKGIKDGIR